VGPPLTIAPAPSAAPFPELDAEAPQAAPVTATFIDLNAAGAPLKVRTCEQVVVSVVQGKGNALGDDLGEGDFLVTQGEGALTVKGEGLALVAAVRTDPCTPRHAKEAPPLLTHRTLRSNAASELTWGGGKMHAHLDVENDLTGAYAGRISGAGPILEHAHEGSWEFLCAVQGSGTYTLDGQSKRLAPRQVVVVSPKTKHSFTPDDGSTLSGIQFYWPRGPEQRFRDLDRKERAPKGENPPNHTAPHGANHARDAGPAEKVRGSLP